MGARSWPELPWTEWQPTVETVHRWLQIVGKVRLALMPPWNHWWQITLALTARGLTTGPMPYAARALQVDLDFLDHQLLATDSDGRVWAMALAPRSVADFYRELADGLRTIGIEVSTWPVPVEVEDATPFPADERHATYDPGHAEALWRGLLQADRVLKAHQTGFVGKASPVGLFWGSFDLATSRYSGRPAPRHPGGIANCPTWVMEEAYSREEAAAGWWPASEPPGPAFYAYTYPEPSGYRAAAVLPSAATYDPSLGEFILPYDAVRASPDPDATALAFFRSTYEAGADLGGWDRSALEPVEIPDRPPRRPWSLAPDVPP